MRRALKLMLLSSALLFVAALPPWELMPEWAERDGAAYGEIAFVATPDETAFEFHLPGWVGPTKEQLFEIRCPAGRSVEKAGFMASDDSDCARPSSISLGNDEATGYVMFEVDFDHAECAPFHATAFVRCR